VEWAKAAPARISAATQIASMICSALAPSRRAAFTWPSMHQGHWVTCATATAISCLVRVSRAPSANTAFENALKASSAWGASACLRSAWARVAFGKLMSGMAFSVGLAGLTWRLVAPVVVRPRDRGEVRCDHSGYGDQAVRIVRIGRAQLVQRLDVRLGGLDRLAGHRNREVEPFCRRLRDQRRQPRLPGLLRNGRRGRKQECHHDRDNHPAEHHELLSLLTVRGKGWRRRLQALRSNGGNRISFSRRICSWRSSMNSPSPA